jgi:hypothetical protein
MGVRGERLREVNEQADLGSGQYPVTQQGPRKIR